MKNNKKEELFAFLKQIGFQKEETKKLLNNEFMREKILPEQFALYKELTDDSKQR